MLAEHMTTVDAISRLFSRIYIFYKITMLSNYSLLQYAACNRTCRRLQMPFPQTPFSFLENYLCAGGAVISEPPAKVVLKYGSQEMGS